MGNKKAKTPKIKEPIKLRYKESKSTGIKSIYLAHWNGNKWEYEFLKLYLNPETTSAIKEKNAETLRLANSIKSRKVAELQNNVHCFSNGSTRSNVNVIDYIKALAEKKRIKAGGGKRTTEMSYLAFLKRVIEYSGKKTTFKQIDKAYCLGFIEYLKTAENHNIKRGQKVTISEGTVVDYTRKLIAVINNAISDEIINYNPFNQIKSENKPKRTKTEIIYLTIDEVKMLENTACLSRIVKQCFLFSCYTGLRFSDVQSLTWGQLQKDNNGGIFINYIQKKTKKQEYLPIPQKAIEFFPDKIDAKDTDKVFYLPSTTYTNLQLKTWAALAGLKKHLTFHIARHTYATTLLSLGAGIETISKNLGHSEIKTTQAHYAAIENKLQRAAVNLFDKITV